MADCGRFLSGVCWFDRGVERGFSICGGRTEAEVKENLKHASRTLNIIPLNMVAMKVQTKQCLFQKTSVQLSPDLKGGTTSETKNLTCLQPRKFTSRIHLQFEFRVLLLRFLVVLPVLIVPQRSPPC